MTHDMLWLVPGYVCIGASTIFVIYFTRNTIFAGTREARLDSLILVYSALGRTHKPHKSRLALIRNLMPCSLVETSDTELRSQKVSYLKSRVSYWSREKQKMERHNAAHALLCCYITNQLTNSSLLMLRQHHCYGPRTHPNIYIYI